MPQNKTTYINADVIAFVENIANEQQKQDSYQLISLMEAATGEAARMFGTSIIGFGQYHYKYESGHEGDAPLVAFSPRKAAISLYIFTGGELQENLLTQLGKFKMGKACIYVKKMSDIDVAVLTEMMQSSIELLSNQYTRIIAQ